MNTCTTCGKPVNRGGGAGGSHNVTRCLICRTAETMRGWRYPASTISQRKLREKKATR